MATVSAQPFACVARAWQAHEGELLGYLRHRIADPDAADDVLQDVFLKAFAADGSVCCHIPRPDDAP